MSISRKILKPLFNAYLYIFASRRATRKLEDAAKHHDNNIEELVGVVFSFKYKLRFSNRFIGLRPGQVKMEIGELCRIVQESDPKTVLEIGTASGATLFLFAHVANPERIISVDLPEGSFGGGYLYGLIPFFKSLGKKNVIKLIRADSHREETLSKIRSLLKGNKVDLLFIDGDHTYEGVKQDFQMYSPLVRKGGIVAFHDIVRHDSKAGCGVDKFWDEIKQSYGHLEIVEDWNQKWAGIGILYL